MDRFRVIKIESDRIIFMGYFYKWTGSGQICQLTYLVKISKELILTQSI